MTPVLADLVTLSALPLRASESDFAADATGFTTTRFRRWYDHKYGKEQDRREWVKLHAMVGVKTNAIVAAEVTDWRKRDSPYFQPLLTATAKHFDVREVSAYKAYPSRADVRAAEDLGGTPTSRSRPGIPGTARRHSGRIVPAPRHRLGVGTDVRPVRF